MILIIIYNYISLRYNMEGENNEKDDGFKPMNPIKKSSKKKDKESMKMIGYVSLITFGIDFIVGTGWLLYYKPLN